MEPFFEWAMQRRAEVREAFDDYKMAAYELAAEECRGRLLNEKGMALGIDALDLFEGNHVRANAYASPELKEHWQTHTRPVFARFAQQYNPYE